MYNFFPKQKAIIQRRCGKHKLITTELNKEASKTEGGNGKERKSNSELSALKTAVRNPAGSSVHPRLTSSGDLPQILH